MTVGGGFGFPPATANYTVAAWLHVASTDVEPPVAAVLSNEIPWGVGPPGGWSLSLDAPGPGAPQIDSANGGLRMLAPSIGVAGQHGEFSWRAVFGNGVERGNANQ